MAACRTGAQGHCGTEAESGDDERALEFILEPVEGGKNVTDFGFTIVRAIAEAGSAKVESQDRPAESPMWMVERLHGVVDNFVVKRAAEDWMRMADERREWSIGVALIQNCFKTARGTRESDASNGT